MRSEASRWVHSIRFLQTMQQESILLNPEGSNRVPQTGEVKSKHCAEKATPSPKMAAESMVRIRSPFIIDGCAIVTIATIMRMQPE